MTINATIEHWLNDLTAEPMDAIQRLILGKVAIPAWSRASLREIFIEVYQAHAAALDGAVTGWLQERLLKMPPERTPTLVWATDLQEVFRAIAGLPLPRLAFLLRDRMRDFRIWLAPLATDKSLDPEAAYLAALAWVETNRHLEGLWQGLVLRRIKEPLYFIDIGLLGLRKGRDEQGKLPPKAPFELLATLIDLADAPDVSKKYWFQTTCAILGGYRCSQETWAREFRPILEARSQAKNGPKWIKGILPSLEKNHSSTGKPAIFQPIPLHESKAMIGAVFQQGTLVDGLEHFLNRHRHYAVSTHESHFIVRTFNQLAEAARRHDPDWAIARAEEALTWDRNNARNWTVLARCLWARGLQADKAGDAAGAQRDGFEAMDTLWEARLRFSWDPFVRTELAKLYRDAGDVDTAEAVYREAMIEFPQNDVCRNGLAETLRGKGLIDEAIQVYRETRAMFPKDPISRNGLSGILLYQSAINHDEHTREEARAILQEAVDLGDRTALFRMKTNDQRWNQLASQPEAPIEEHEGLNESIALKKADPSEMRPAQRLGRSLLLQWQAGRAVSSEEQEHLCNQAEDLLDIQEEQMGECRAAFLEARGFLLLARGLTAEAVNHFEQLATSYTLRTIRLPLGIRLGLVEARTRLGEPVSPEDEKELMAFGPDGSILPLVLKVIRLLKATTDDTELSELLIELYPRVLELSGRSTDDDKDRQPRKSASADTMIAQLLMHNVFWPASITNIDDLHDSSALTRLCNGLNAHSDQFYSVYQELALAA
jgi:tetratricopeptide (TPR) repeat protein